MFGGRGGGLPDRDLELSGKLTRALKSRAAPRHLKSERTFDAR